jgi:hypothetical protein
MNHFFGLVPKLVAKELACPWAVEAERSEPEGLGLDCPRLGGHRIHSQNVADFGTSPFCCLIRPFAG